MKMHNALLADELVARLNSLIKKRPIREDIGSLLLTNVPCHEPTIKHPTIQTQAWRLGVLGLLNGLVGVDPNLKGGKKGHGYISAVFEDDGAELVCFERTKNKP
jgi:hypothetical protein